MKSDHLIDKDHVGQPLYCQPEKRHLKGSDLGQETLTHLTGRLVITHQARHSRISALRDTQSVKHNHSHDHGRSNPTPGLSPQRNRPHRPALHRLLQPARAAKARRCPATRTN